MIKQLNKRIPQTVFLFALALIVYMPLHVLIVQSVSLLTGGLNEWKAAKDIFIVLLVPLLLYLSYLQGLFKNKTFRWLIIIAGLYTLIHGLFVVFDTHDDTYSAIVGSVYNIRILAYLLLGYVVGSFKDGRRYLRYLLTTAFLVATLVALFGVLQYFLPSDLLKYVGYTLDRGVKYMFFIDDKPNLPRVMSTLKDPNSLGAYLILPILMATYTLTNNKVNKEFFVRPFKKSFLSVALVIQVTALVLTFSRGALLGLALSLTTLVLLFARVKMIYYLKRYIITIVILAVLSALVIFQARNSYLFQNIVFHADKSTVLADPNEKRVVLTRQATEDILVDPLGHGPGSAGLVSIKNPKGGLLTENYYLQIGYEVGWLGIVLFIAILSIIGCRLLMIVRKYPIGAVLFASLVGYLFYSLLIHLWSNEAVALQWWLLTGTILGLSIHRKTACP